MCVLETKGLALEQGTKFLIKDIDWQVREKENWIIFGLNGCGKTTLLSIIAGYRNYNHGKVYLFNEKLSPVNAISKRSRVGFASSSFFNNCLRYENVLSIVTGSIFGELSERFEIQDKDFTKAIKLLSAFGLREKARYPYDLLSRGQQQKVLLTRALMVQPKLLILDEPCEGLDIYSRDFFLNTLNEIAHESCVTVIYVTHHADEILPIFNKALLMKEGKIHSQGDVKSIFSSTNLTDFFDQPTEVRWIDDRIQFQIKDDLKMDKAIWNRNN